MDIHYVEWLVLILAKNTKIDILICDRTFSSVGNFASFKFHWIFKLFYRILVWNWDIQSDENYIEA